MARRSVGRRRLVFSAAVGVLTLAVSPSAITPSEILFSDNYRALRS